MKEMIIKFWSGVSGFGEVYDSYYQSYIFETKRKMNSYIKDNMAKSDMEYLLKFELLNTEKPPKTD